MPNYVARLWAPQDRGLLSSRDFKPGTYRAFVPDELELSLPVLSAHIEARLAEALGAVVRADAHLGLSAKYLNHLLLRSESISSSWIEGNRITPKKLAIAEALNVGNRVALDVIGNVQATEAAIDSLASAPDISLDAICDLQQRIEPRLDAGLRKEQNWVGGTGFSPLRAEFVPPPETEVERLMQNLCAFASRREGNALLRAAIAHAQFETIHPFIDGNGRTGRALIHTILKRSGVVKNSLLPISTQFAAQPSAYIAGLTSFRAAPQELEAWVEYFAEAAERSAAAAERLAIGVVALDEANFFTLVEHRRIAGKSPAQPRADAIVLKLLSELAVHPVLTVKSAALAHAVSEPAAYKALLELESAGIMQRSKDHKGKLLCFTSDEHLRLIEERTS